MNGFGGVFVNSTSWDRGVFTRFVVGALKVLVKSYVFRVGLRSLPVTTSGRSRGMGQRSARLFLNKLGSRENTTWRVPGSGDVSGLVI